VCLQFKVICTCPNKSWFGNRPLAMTNVRASSSSRPPPKTPYIVDSFVLHPSHSILVTKRDPGLWLKPSWALWSQRSSWSVWKAPDEQGWAEQVGPWKWRGWTFGVEAIQAPDHFRKAHGDSLALSPFRHGNPPF
jgi:hypothetical protein